MKYLLIILILILTGCDTIAPAFTGCEKRKVQEIDCVVCAKGDNGVSVSCDWSK